LDFLLNHLPTTNIGRFAWILEFGYLVVGAVLYLLFLVQDSLEQSGDLPRGDSLRERDTSVFDQCRNRPILHRSVKAIYSRAGYIQEEEISSGLEEEVLSRGESLREISALSILTALFFTFLTLFWELSDSITQTSDQRLAKIIELVGVNWPGILAALICTVCAIHVRRRNESLLKRYRQWLDYEVFPKTSAGRTTVDDLRALIAILSTTVEKLSTGLQPLGSLPAVLAKFQNDIISGVVPKVIEGIQRIPVSLSSTAIQQLSKISGDSNKLIVQLTRDYATLLLLSQESERRQIEIAAGINQAVAGIRDLGPAMTTVVTALSNNSHVAEKLMLEVQGLGAELRGLGGQIPAILSSVQEVGAKADALGKPIEEATAAVSGVRSELGDVSANVARFIDLLETIQKDASSADRSIALLVSELQSFSPKLEKTAYEFGVRLSSMETVASSTTERLREISSATIAETTRLTGAIAEANRALSGADKSLTDTANRLFEQAGRAREDERQALIAAATVLQSSVKALEGKINDTAEVIGEAGKLIGEAARTISDSLGQLGRLSGQIKNLDAKVNALNTTVTELDRATRGGPLFRRMFTGGSR
jgi:hypothetical protein